MKKILIVSATDFEIEPLIIQLQFEKSLKPNLQQYSRNNLIIEILITGVGMTFTAFEMGKTISGKYDFALNFGIAGSFNRSLKPGDIINITQDHFAEIGAENDKEFLSIFDLGLQKPDEFPFTKTALVNTSYIDNPSICQLKKVSAITVNTVHGNEASIKKTLSKFPVDVESMEGAAFLYVCLSEKIPCAQIRSISNYVEKRNRNAWNIPLAVANLNDAAIEILNGFEI